MISVSVGPASRSIPTRPKSWRFASATYAFPGPTSMSTGLDALGPERHRGHRLDAAEHEDLVGAAEVHRGDDRRMRARRRTAARRRRPAGTPAALAVTTLMCAEATIG